MFKPQKPRMQRLPPQPGDNIDSGIREQGLARPGCAAAIDRVAHDGIAEMGHMYPDLMGAPGFQAAFNERRAAGRIGGFRAVIGTRRLAARRQNRHFFAITRASADISLDRTVARVGHAPDEGGVGALDRVLGKLPGEPFMGGARLRGHHQPACVFVQAVNDSRPAHTANSFQAVAAMGDQGVDQGTGQVSRRRVDDKSGRFVDHDQVVVFEDHVERDIFPQRLRVDGFRNPQEEAFPRFDPVGGLDYRPPAIVRSCQTAIFNEPFEKRPGPVGQGVGQEAVDAFTFGTGRYGDIQRRGKSVFVDGVFFSHGRVRTYSMRGLKALVIGMGVLIIVGVVFLLYAIIQKSGDEAALGGRTPGAPVRSDVTLPAGAEVVETRLDSNTIVLRLRLADGSGRLVVIDRGTGKATGRIDLKFK